MKKLLRISFPVALAVATSLPACGDVLWSAGEGTTSILFNPEALQDLGIELSAVVETTQPVRSGALGFRATGLPGLRFDLAGGDLEAIGSGELRHDGGFVLRVGEATLDFRGFTLRRAAPPAALVLQDRDGVAWLTGKNPQPFLRHAERQVYLMNVDLLVSGRLAARLGRPDLEGLYVGRLDAVLRIEGPGIPSPDGGCVARLDLPADIVLTGIEDLSQVAREPGGRVALAPSARLVNDGPGTVEWYQAIEPDSSPDRVGPHPFLALHMYRLADGVVRQIGRSDLKHAFFTVNIGCPCAPGHLFYPGCEDVYGVSTNENRLYLGPRAELQLPRVEWSSLGSHFDALPIDDFRDHHGNADHDAFEHRLVVAEAELLVSPARYFIEAWYVTGGDPNIFNSMGHVEVNPVFSNGFWTFAALGPLRLGPVLGEWVAPEEAAPSAHASLLRTVVGSLQMAVRTSPGSASLVRYEYALQNFDGAWPVRSVSIPVPEGVTVSAIEFEDVDDDVTNDWSAATSDGAVTWTAPEGNGLPWGTLFNFRFEADAAAGLVAASLLGEDSSATARMATLAPGGAASGPRAEILGTCPGPVRVTASGLTPEGAAAVVSGEAAGWAPVPKGRCLGTVLPLSDPRLAVSTEADASGTLEWIGELPAGACGSSLVAIDLSSCAVTEPLRLD